MSRVETERLIYLTCHRLTILRSDVRLVAFLLEPFESHTVVEHAVETRGHGTSHLVKCFSYLFDVHGVILLCFLASTINATAFLSIGKTGEHKLSFVYF